MTTSDRMCAENLLRQFGDADRDELPLWTALVDSLRPRRAADVADATGNLRALTDILSRRGDLRERLRGSLLRLFRDKKQVSLHVASGLLPSSGFFSESARRIQNRLLPEVLDTRYMKDVLCALFPRGNDHVWVEGIDDACWIELLTVLFDDGGSPTSPSRDVPPALAELLEGLRVLSYQVSAIGLDPEPVRVDPTLEEYESPFLAQNVELLAYIEHYRRWWRDPAAPIEEAGHLWVMLDQCAEVLQRIHRRAAKIGTSLNLTFKLERLRQHLARIGDLVALLERLREDRRIVAVAPQLVRLFKQLVYAETRKNNLSDYWKQNVELLSLRMTESASRTGERYITSTRTEYVGMLGSAALGGLIIAFMAGLKIVLARQGFAPLNEALSFCLNYGIGFVLIHVLGGTVATKQPAMTANAIAASIGEARGKTRDLHELADLVVRTWRSQFAAILGNVGIAVPFAILLALLFQTLAGTPFVGPEKAVKLLGEVDPLGAAPVFAAIAGVCLFLSGLIAGYYDNLSAYNRIPQRLLQLRWPTRLLGEARMQRVAAYLEKNLGALAGNFFFGFLLGGVTALGMLFGLPLDIRHIAFSSAYVGYAAVGLDFALSPQAVALAALGVGTIGTINLLVSFSLTLYVAMRARRISFAQGGELGRLIAQRLLTRPLDFLLPPAAKTERDGADTESPASARPGAAAEAGTDESGMIDDGLGDSRPNG